MKVYLCLIYCGATIMLVGCLRDKPEPEVKFPLFSTGSVEAHENMTAVFMGQERNLAFFVHHLVKGNDLLVECRVNGISFRTGSRNEGKILVSVNGKHIQEFTSAAFIIKGLSEGTHKIKLEIVDPDNTPYHLYNEFYITIP